jgi:Stigma-specific protein, Stig1
MRAAVLFSALACIAAAGCPGTAPGTGTTSGSGSGTSGSGTTGGTSSGGSTSGGSGPGGPCGAGLIWVGDVCAATDCTKAPLYVTCALPADAGFGQCIGLRCVTLNLSSNPPSCGSYGLSCPPDAACDYGSCISAVTHNFVDCATEHCLSGQCIQYVGCIPATCDTNAHAKPCLLDAGGPAAFPFPAMGICCGAECPDVASDRNNCGNCGLACAQDELCVAHACVKAETCGPLNNGHACALPSGGTAGTCCMGTCVDAKSDSANCGGCSKVCNVDAGCVGGKCTYGNPGCPAGTGPDGIGGCLPETCAADSLGTPCVADAGGTYYSCCSAGCIDVTSDPQNCGACGVTCRPGTTCIYSSCQEVFDCATTNRSCALDGGGNSTGVCCGGGCVDTRASDLNCSECGVACPLGTHCGPSGCTVDGGFQPVNCDGGDCPPGTSCAGGTCIPSLCTGTYSICVRDGGSSLVTGSCCGTACVDVGFDPSNCGGCGIHCPAGTSCVGSICQSSGGPPGDCPPGTACDFPGSPCPNTGSCVPLSCAGRPTTAPCAFGPFNYYLTIFGQCCGDACVDLIRDPRNCGVCGQVCASGICSSGVCVEPDPPGGCLQSCAPNTRCVRGLCIDSTCDRSADCLAEDGTVGVCCYPYACGHLRDDPQNCGVCGIICPLGQTCENGTCSGSPACGPGHMGEFCDLDAGTNFLCCPGYGCIDVSSDQLNCGACQELCPTGMICQNGFCK